MSPAGPAPADVSDAARAMLGELVSSYAARHPDWDPEATVEVIEVEPMLAGRPGIVDVVARLGSRTVHVPFGLRTPGEEGRFVPEGEDAVLGTFDDGRGPVVAFEATRDVEVAVMLLQLVSEATADAALVRPVSEDAGATTLAFDDRLAFTVYHEVVDGARPDLELFLALDEVGFNHLAAPVAVWRRHGRDLGLVQEYLPGASSGSALALTSVRDLYASGGPPELAGGDFGAEAHRLGTMAARMHVCLDKAFGHDMVDVGPWAEEIRAAVGAAAPEELERPETQELLDELGGLRLSSPVIRTHGDFHLGRTSRTEQGWYVVDFASAARPATTIGAAPRGGEGGPVLRPAVADVADMLWSFGVVAGAAADERDPSGRDGLAELARAWVTRNRRAFLAGYLGVPGISALVPPGRDALRVFTAALELVRSVAHGARRGDGPS